MDVPQLRWRHDDVTVVMATQSAPVVFDGVSSHAVKDPEPSKFKPRTYYTQSFIRNDNDNTVNNSGTQIITTYSHSYEPV